MGKAGTGESSPGRASRSHPLEIRALITLAIILVLTAATIYVVLSVYWGQTQPALRNPALLVAAARAYARDQEVRGRPVPQEVSMQDLVNLGYLDPKDVEAFQGMEVTLMPAAPTDNPLSVLARMKLPDGTQIAVLANGSVQQLSK